MTTYILHGGATSTENEQNDNFFKQFTAHIDKDEVRILLCYWARSEEERSEILKRDKNKILKNSKKKIIFEVAQDPDDLFKKLKTCDVMYVVGGDPKLIEPYYKHLKKLKKALDGKIYLGSSMGAFLTSISYVVSSSKYKRDFVQSGVGLLPIQLLCHWDVEKKKELKRNLLLKNSNQPILTLNEFEFVEIYQ